MPRGRHRKTKTPRFAKTAQIVALSLLCATAVVPSMASFSDSSSASISVKAAQWVTPSVVTSGYNSATINWNAIPGYSNYTVQWSKTPEFDFPVSATVSGTSFSTTELTDGTVYYWRVKPTTDDPSVTWSLGPISGATQEANGSLGYGDIVGYSRVDNNLWNFGKTQTDIVESNRTLLMSGLQQPSHLFVTDWNADGIEDLVYQTTYGTVEARLGKVGGGFNPLTISMSNTWNEYDVTIGRWLNINKLPGILAIEKSTGNLYYYQNPNGTQHGARTAIGTGWNGFAIAMVDFDNDGHQDLVARQPGTGDLLLYRSRNGGFVAEARKRIGVGWDSMDSISTVNDSEGPGTRGIIARQVSTSELWYYPIKNEVIGDRRKIGAGLGNYQLSGS